MSCIIYHIAELQEWDEQGADSHYAPGRFAGEGFIHCSKARQLEGVANDNFSGRSDLVLLFIDPAKLEARMVHEGKRDKFPHIYGKINKDAVTRTTRIECNEDGLFAGVLDRAVSDHDLS